MNVILLWFKRHFADPQIVFLTLILLTVFAVVVLFGDMLMPVLASLVIAYLLEGGVGMLQRRGWKRLPSVLVIYLAFIAFVALALIGVMPLLSRQIKELVQQLPTMVSEGLRFLNALPEDYPDLFSQQQIDALITYMRAETISFGQQVLSWSLANVAGIITLLVYLVLVPILVFFFMKDKDLILAWFRRYLPRHHGIAHHVWRELDRQIANYIRGKVWEILIVWGVSFVTFYAFGLRYAMLLSFLVGLSVLIPYIGATVVTIPVLLVAWFQWGWSAQFAWLSLAYLIIQVLDGNVLVPLIFSEAVNLHPVAIIVAILVFGGLWNFWGVFFAIPLATLVQAVINAWPSLPLGEREIEGSVIP
ncbi:AI-2E family transporter [Caldichromatium japonicum]|uniref:AI-2E family transporter n=1 Tax=Caldichromatium japonicum TaxID=2699430 RepID=A0A6G7VEF3_9GAMM|nr:AI-2E family transporter [Caldichromatium japonicum]QIK38290.1 AI-2E family transporter [Caldichromatium japonicum]